MKKIISYIITIILVCTIMICSLSLYVKLKTRNRILELKDLKQVEEVDCILVLGAGVNGLKPSPMLKDRLDASLKLYNKGISNKIIMSGDHGQDNYNEVKAMKTYGIEHEIPSENIFMDHAGFSTYDSIYRAKEIFGVKKVIIVSQEYHLYRALYIAESLGIEAYGYSSDTRKYKGNLKREIREILARDKDFVKSIIKPEPTFLGEAIPVSGAGNITNDDYMNENK